MINILALFKKLTIKKCENCSNFHHVCKLGLEQFSYKDYDGYCSITMQYLKQNCKACKKYCSINLDKKHS